MVLEPTGNLLYLWQFMGFGFVIAADPAMHLARHITFRLAQIAQADGVVIQRVKLNKAINKRFVEFAGHTWTYLESGRQIAAQDNSAQAIHRIERPAQHRWVVAIEHWPWGWIDRMHLGKHAIFTPHVMRALHLAAEGRTPQHQFKHFSVARFTER